MDSWYFAYGSNMCVEQLIRRIGRIGIPDSSPRIAQLAGHRLAFQHGVSGGAAYANILAPGDGVIGVAYRFSASDLEKLDRFEEDYDHGTIEVTDRNGEVLRAVAYFMTPGPNLKYGLPSSKYLRTIVTGARQHGLPEVYIENIISRAGAVESD